MRRKLLPVFFGTTIFASACLLFLVQPLASKLILPWFGGSAAVWITCMLFFQAGLLLGYLYAHGLTRRLSTKHQAILHASLLIASLAALPILPNPIWQPKPGQDPTWLVFGVLAMSVGLPYVLLSSTTPLLQSWYARMQLGALPYRYFALSNAGSLIALLAYPILVEPNLTGHRTGLDVVRGFCVVRRSVCWRRRLCAPPGRPGISIASPAIGRQIRHGSNPPLACAPRLRLYLAPCGYESAHPEYRSHAAVVGSSA